MNQEQIIQMAREAGIAIKPPSWGYRDTYEFGAFTPQMERFAALVTDVERKRCAQMCETRGWYVTAQAIREGQ